MAQPVRITLNENERVVLERQEGGKYALRMFKDGRDQGLMGGVIDRNTTLVISGSGKNASLTIPGNIDFAPRIQVDTDEKLRIENGAFILAKESKRSVIITSNNTTLTRPSLSLGGQDDDERFPANARVVGFSPINQIRSFAIEQGAPAVEILSISDNKVLATLSGSDTLQQTAQRLGVQVPVAPAAQPAAQPPARAPAQPAQPAERAPNTPLTTAQQTNLNLMADGFRTMARMLPELPPDAPQAQKDVRASYDRINDAAQKLKGGNNTQQNIQDFRRLVEDERNKLSNLAKDNPNLQEARDLSGALTSNLENINRISRIAFRDPAPVDRNNIPRPPGFQPPLDNRPPANNPGAQNGMRGESLTRLATQARQFSTTSDNRDNRAAMATLADAAEKAARDQSPKNLEDLNKALDNAMEGARKGVNSGRSLKAPMELEMLQKMKDQFGNPQPGRRQGAAIPPAGMSPDVLAAASNALDPSLTRQQGLERDQNGIQRSSGIPGAGGVIQIT